MAVRIIALALLCATFARGDNITVSAGGIIKPGDDLVLTYKVDLAPWDRCYWFRLGKDDSNEYCSFAMDFEAPYAVTKRRCLSANDDIKERMVYSGTTNDECAVTLKNVTIADNTTWEVNVDAQRETKQVQVIVASPIEGAEIDLGADQSVTGLKLGEEGTIRCSVRGGRPAPIVSLAVADLNVSKIINDALVQTPDEDGVYESIQSLVITPGIEDHGCIITCSASLVDGDKAPLYDPVTNSSTLAVVFPPQPMANQSGNAYENNFITMAFVFQANPPPTEFKWVVIPPGANEDKEHAESRQDDETTEVPDKEDNKNETGQVLVQGFKDDKYTVRDLLKVDEDGIKFRLELDVMNLTLADAENAYMLSVTNDQGTQNYFYRLTVVKEGTPTTPKPTPDDQNGVTTTTPKNEGDDDSLPSSGAGYIFGILALVAVIGIVLGSLFMYRKRMATDAVSGAPMASMERRR